VLVSQELSLGFVVGFVVAYQLLDINQLKPFGLWSPSSSFFSSMLCDVV
jgi:hypothetical protein